MLVEEAVAGGARFGKACDVIGLPARTLQRWIHRPVDGRRGPRRSPANKLSQRERNKIVEIATSPEFRDMSPKQIVPLLTDRGTYVASESSFYRVLHDEQLQHRRTRTRPPSKRPHEHVADGPWQVASWDITYLRSHVRGQFFFLYLVVDVWSRKILGWDVHESESSEHAARLVERVRQTANRNLDGWVLHSDNGGPMKGATMLATLQRLGVVPSFSRPRVSDDNPFAESLFRTLKYAQSIRSTDSRRSTTHAAGSPRSYTGTTTSISTAASASSPLLIDTSASTSTSSLLVAVYTSVLVVAVPNGGRVTCALGHGPRSSCSTRSATWPHSSRDNYLDSYR
jgi:putative transposase